MGNNHAFAVTRSADSYQLYSWGSNKFGQLGHWDYENRSEPTLIDLDFEVSKDMVALGKNFSIIKDSYTNQLYTCGSNQKGELGTGHHYNSANSFQKVQNIPINT